MKTRCTFVLTVALSGIYNTVSLRVLLYSCTCWSKRFFFYPVGHRPAFFRATESTSLNFLRGIALYLIIINPVLQETVSSVLSLLRKLLLFTFIAVTIICDISVIQCVVSVLQRAVVMQCIATPSHQDEQAFVQLHL